MPPLLLIFIVRASGLGVGNDKKLYFSASKISFRNGSVFDFFSVVNYPKRALYVIFFLIFVVSGNGCLIKDLRDGANRPTAYALLKGENTWRKWIRLIVQFWKFCK
ncbi:hypothetical protein EMIT0194MI4_30446 [Pseudomonas sp. IT-194MI4]